ncbi:MAG: hypothetical protein U0U67_06025 [Chitinophagales bacterium]
MNNKPVKYAAGFFLACFVVIVIARKIDNRILLFPLWLKTILYVVALPIAYSFIKKWAIFAAQKESDNNMVKAVNVLCTVLLAFIISLLIKLPLNAFIIQQSRKNESITQMCPITYYSTSLKNQEKKHITFMFQNKNIRMKVKPTTMQKIKSLPSVRKNIQLQLRKSILGMYVVEDYDIE